MKTTSTLCAIATAASLLCTGCTEKEDFEKNINNQLTISKLSESVREAVYYEKPAQNGKNATTELYLYTVPRGEYPATHLRLCYIFLISETGVNEVAQDFDIAFDLQTQASETAPGTDPESRWNVVVKTTGFFCECSENRTTAYVPIHYGHLRIRRKGAKFTIRFNAFVDYAIKLEANWSGTPTKEG